MRIHQAVVAVLMCSCAHVQQVECAAFTLESALKLVGEKIALPPARGQTR